MLSVLPTRKYVGPISSDITEEREKDEEEKYFRNILFYLRSNI